MPLDASCRAERHPFLLKRKHSLTVAGAGIAISTSASKRRQSGGVRRVSEHNLSELFSYVLSRIPVAKMISKSRNLDSLESRFRISRDGSNNCICKIATSEMRFSNGTALFGSIFIVNVKID